MRLDDELLSKAVRVAAVTAGVTAVAAVAVSAAAATAFAVADPEPPGEHTVIMSNEEYEQYVALLEAEREGWLP
ncbi:hypothetical protein AB0J38_17000 [Streptomyces sp. NPDC050095]|uniref:hypothetical protein n=1 Tax=unclassified Streptomyces TaxID=2593676 RepID=UPI003432AF84